LSLSGATSWLKGTMKGDGGVTVPSGAALTLPVTTTGDRTLLRSLTNQGTMKVSKGLSAGLYIGNIATLTNSATGVIDLNGDASIKATTGSGDVDNHGIVKHSGGGTAAAIGTRFTSALEGVNVVAGTLLLTGGGAVSGKAT